MISEELLEILACPKCKGPLTWNKEKNTLDCAGCRVRYPVTDGIPELLIDRAQTMEQ